MPPNKRILEQIEQSADFYGPQVYSLLSFYSNFQPQLDAVGQEFIPVSQTKQNPKLFVVGLIPPVANITGRLLDRSGTVGAIEGAPQDLEYTEGPSQSPSGDLGSTIVSVPGYQMAALGGSSDLPGVKPSDGGVCPNGTVVLAEKPGGVGGNLGYERPADAAGCNTSNSVQQLWKAYHDAYVSLYKTEPTPTEMEILVAHSLLEGGASAPGNNPGGIGNYMTANPPKLAGTGAVGTWGVTRNTKQPDGSFKEVTSYYNSYPDFATGARDFVKMAMTPRARTAAAAGDVIAYTTVLASNTYFGEPTKGYYEAIRQRLDRVYKDMASSFPGLGDPSQLPRKGPDSCAFKETMFEYRNRVKGDPEASKNRFTSTSVYDEKCELGGSNEPKTGPDWQGQGSANASASEAETAKTANTDLNKSDLGKKFQDAQKAEIIQTIKLIETMRNTPPLRLLVNPSSFKLSSEKITSDGNWTRNGPIVEHWGDAQDKLEASGKVAAFLAIDTQGEGSGLTRVARNYSASYHNLLSLWLLYRNNGNILTYGLDEKAGSTTRARLSMTGSVYIYYDNILYFGSFDNFNLTESDTAPFSMEYTYQFTVRASFVLDRPDEYDYGAKQFFQGSSTPLPTTQTALVPEEGGDVAIPEGASVEQQEAFIASLGNGVTAVDPAVARIAKKDPPDQLPTPTEAQRKGRK